MADTFCCLINVITPSFSTMATGIGPDCGCHNNLNLAQKGRMRHIEFCFLSLKLSLSLFCRNYIENVSNSDFSIVILKKTPRHSEGMVRKALGFVTKTLSYLSGQTL